MLRLCINSCNFIKIINPFLSNNAAYRKRKHTKSSFSVLCSMKQTEIKLKTQKIITGFKFHVRRKTTFPSPKILKKNTNNFYKIGRFMINKI